MEELARGALEGSRASLEQMVAALQGDIFGLALRMLGSREDAEDATREILIRIVTRLSRFDFRSRLSTWACWIAVNYVLDFMRRAGEKRTMRFEQLGADVVAAISPEAPSETEHSLFGRGGKDRLHLGDAPMSRCRAPRGLHSGRDHGGLRPASGRGVAHFRGALTQAAAKGAWPPCRHFSGIIADLYPTTPRAGATGKSRPHCEQAVCRPHRRGLPQGLHSRSCGRECARWKRLAGRSRYIASASLLPRRWTSPGGWSPSLTRILCKPAEPDRDPFGLASERYRPTLEPASVKTQAIGPTLRSATPVRSELAVRSSFNAENRTLGGFQQADGLKYDG